MKVIPKDLSTGVARALALRFGGDRGGGEHEWLLNRTTARLSDYNKRIVTAAPNFYPPGPTVPEGFARPTAAYRRHAWTASTVLLLFVLMYLSLAGWFLLTAWRLGAAVVNGATEALIGGVSALFLAVFMLKGLFFVKRGSLGKGVEVTREEQPRLFEFLDRLAHEAGAPRPRRVFLSTQVNACVFYDLSVLNLILPSRKNLEIGLGLVNVLSLGEFKAVCAHEFGHFAQRTMAVGRWVYVAQQIAVHIIAKRDALDDLLNWVSGIDVRVAWIGWILRLIVWSIRSLLESAFRLVVLAERALSRDMEMQADLVAVSLTGSDALIEALDKLGAADDAFDRSLGFFGSEAATKRPIRDIFTIQSRVIERIRSLRGDDSQGGDPERAGLPRPAHRVFKEEIGEPPRMWSTHPPNNEREENAKRTYIVAPIDDRPAWTLFEDASALRERLTAGLLEPPHSPAVDIGESLGRLDEGFDREHLDSRYRGVFYGRSPVRMARRVGDLFDSFEGDRAVFSQLYPASLAEDMQLLRTLNKELAMLRAIADADLEARGGVIRHRGQEVPRATLDAAIQPVEGERTELNRKLAAHDHLCRSAHLFAASRIGGGWHDYLVSLCALVHYADHTQADLRDAHASFASVYQVVTAAGKVSGQKLDWLRAEADGLYSVLARVFEQGNQIIIDSGTAKLLGTAAWPEALGPLHLPDPQEDELGLGVWLSRIDGWVNQTATALESLRRAALDQLLVSEHAVGAHFLEQTAPGTAPSPAAVPASYATLLPGEERRREKTLDWWTRFQIAHGSGPAVARTAVALVIVGGVLAAGALTGQATVVAFNGLARPVRVFLNGNTRLLSAGERAEFSLTPAKRVSIKARTTENQLIEAFQEDVEAGDATYVYNVAGAAPLGTHSVYYGEEGSADPATTLGALRWLRTTADYVLTDPPQSLSLSKGERRTRVVLDAGQTRLAENVRRWLPEARAAAAVIRVHARWDAADSPDILTWLSSAALGEPDAHILEARLKDNPGEVVSLRTQQDAAKGDGHSAICEHDAERARAAAGNADLQYLAARCNSTGEARDRAFVEGWQKWPGNGWFANAAGYALADHGAYDQALAALQVAWRNAPPVASSAAVLAARIRRMQARSVEADVRDLAAVSPELRDLLQTETGVDQAGPARAYASLGQGRLQEALAAAKGSPFENRLVRLVAASDGAPPDALQRVAALPAADNPYDTWIDGALALRRGLDFTPYQKAIRASLGDSGKALAPFVELVRTSQIPAANDQLKTLPLDLRLKASVFGTIALMERAPRDWRESAYYMLFPPERPYLRLEFNSQGAPAH